MRSINPKLLQDPEILPAERLTAEGATVLLGWRGVFLAAFAGLMGVSTTSPPSALTVHRFAVGFDPALAASSIELAWATIAYPFQHLLESLPLRTETQIALLPSLAVAAAAVTVVRRFSLKSPWAFLIGFLVLAAIVKTSPDWNLQPTGPDAVGIGLFLATLRAGGSNAPSSRTGSAAFGFLAASGWVYCALLGGLQAFRKERIQPREIPFALVGAGMNLMVFLLVRVRYPHPDLLPEASPFVEWVGIWRDGVAAGWSAGWTVPPGIVWLGLIGGGILVQFGALRLWGLSAGRTVPVQVILYSIPLLFLGGGVGSILRADGDPDAPPQIEDRWKNLRTVQGKIAHPTELFLFPEDLAAIRLLNRKEDRGPHLRVRMDVGRDLLAEDLWDSNEGAAFRSSSVRIAYNGKNLVRIWGEPLHFDGQYILDSEVEVWAATPEYFVANDPADADNQPVLFFDLHRFGTEDRANLGITDWSFDGRRIYLYKTRGESPWSFPAGEWHIDYLGYLLAEDFERYADTVRPRKRVGMLDFY